MFGGGIDVAKIRQIVEVAVIQLVDHRIDRLLELLEINAHAEVIELRCPHRDLDLPVVAMRPLAVARIGAQVVPSGKVGFNKDVHHALLVWCGEKRIEPGPKQAGEKRLARH